MERERGDWFVLKIPRYDANGVGADEVTVTLERHAQAERTQKQKREEKATSWGGSDKDRARDDGAQARVNGGAPLVTESGVGRLPECTG